MLERRTMTVGARDAASGPRPAPPAFAPYLAVLAGIAYAGWVLGFVLNPRLDAVNGYVSELSASDQPFHYVFAGGDLTAGTLAIAVAGAVLARPRPPHPRTRWIARFSAREAGPHRTGPPPTPRPRRSRRWIARFSAREAGPPRTGPSPTPRARRSRGWEPVGWFALLLFGVFVIGDALFAMDCAPSSDTTCALRERAGRVSFAHEFHLVTSACAVTAGIVSVVALAIAARRGSRVIARWSWPVVVVETGTALATLPLMYFGVLLGVTERIQVSVVSLWLLVVAGELRARRRPRPALEPEGTAGP